MAMGKIPVTSSNIDAYAVSDDKTIVRIWFKRNPVGYEFTVPAEIGQGLETVAGEGGSIGQFFNQNIKGLPFDRVAE